MYILLMISSRRKYYKSKNFHNIMDGFYIIVIIVKQLSVSLPVYYEH